MYDVNTWRRFDAACLAIDEIIRAADVTKRALWENRLANDTAARWRELSAIPATERRARLNKPHNGF